MARGVREFNNRGGDRDFGGGEGFRGRGFGFGDRDFDGFRGFGRFGGGDFDDFRFRYPFFLGGGFPGFFPQFQQPFVNPFGFPGFFGGRPDFDDFRFRGGFDRDFGGRGFRGGDDRGGRRAFATRSDDVGTGRHEQQGRRGFQQGGHSGFGGGIRQGRGGHEGFGLGHDNGRGGFRGFGDRGGRGFGDGRGFRFGGFGDRDFLRGDFDRFRDFGDFDDRFRFGGGDFDDFGGGGNLAQLCLSNPIFAQSNPACLQILAQFQTPQLQGLGVFPGFPGFAGIATAGGALPGKVPGGGSAGQSGMGHVPQMGTMGAGSTTHPAMGIGMARMMAAQPTIHPGGMISHGVGGLPVAMPNGGLEGMGLHPGGEVGGSDLDRGGGFRDPGREHDFNADFDRDRQFRDFDFDEFHRRFFDDDDRLSFFLPRDVILGYGRDFPDIDENGLIALEERCLTDAVFAETHASTCLPIIQAFQGQLPGRALAGERVFAGAAMVGGGAMGGGMAIGGSSGGFHPADPGQGGIGHQSTGVGMMLPGGGGGIQQTFPGRGIGPDRTFHPGDMGGDRDFAHLGDRDFRFRDPVRFFPDRFRIFGDRIFDGYLGDFLPFSYYEYQLVLAQNPLAICLYYPQLCGPPPFLVGQPQFQGPLSYEDIRPPIRVHKRSEDRGTAINMMPAASIMPAAMPMPVIPLNMNVATSSTPQSLQPMFMNPDASTSTGAILPVIPNAPVIDTSMVTPTAMTAMYANAYPATQGTESSADTDVYANIPLDHRGNILGSTAFSNPMSGRNNIQMSNY